MSDRRPDHPLAGHDRRSRALPWALLSSLGVHAVALWVLFAMGPASQPEPPAERRAVEVAIIEPPPPPPPSPPPPPEPASSEGGSPAASGPAPKPAPPKVKSSAPPKAVETVRRRPPEPPKRPAPQALPVRAVVNTPAPLPEPPDPDAEVGEAELAAAITADSAGGGSGDGAGTGGSGSGQGGSAGSGTGSCNMVRRLQNALRKDAKVRAWLQEESRDRSGRPSRLWSRDWLRSGVQEGKGLAGVRQAILVEVGFAPAACRAQVVNGPVLVRLGDEPGAPGIVLGKGRWRWSDLLYPPGGVAGHRRGR